MRTCFRPVIAAPVVPAAAPAPAPIRAPRPPAARPPIKAPNPAPPPISVKFLFLCAPLDRTTLSVTTRVIAPSISTPSSAMARTARPLNLPEGEELLTTPSTLAPRGIRVLLCTTTGETKTPMKRSPGRNRAVSILLFNRTLNAVPAGATALTTAGGSGFDAAGAGTAPGASGSAG